MEGYCGFFEELRKTMRKVEVTEEKILNQEAVAEIRFLREYVKKLENVINASYHVAVFDHVGWALEHSLECRLAKQMTKCGYNAALDKFCNLVTDPHNLINQGRLILTGINSEGYPEMRQDA